MALQLTIHTIDVEQEESALVVAADVAAGRQRTILIDGGLLGYAETVHNFINPILRGYGYSLDHILLSHYDKDHSGGVIGLLNADNMRVVSEAISNAVANAAQWAAVGTRPQQIACGAVAAAATILGAYRLNVHKILTMCQVVFPRAVGKTDDEAAEIGFNYALEHTNTLQSFPTLQVGETGRCKNIAKISSVAAAIAIASGNNPATAAFGAIFLLIGKTLPNQPRFDTAGRYCNVHLIDIRQPIWPSQSARYIPPWRSGKYLNITKANRMITPDINRTLTTPVSGDEILRNSWAGPTPASPHSPGIFCRAINSWVWQGIGNNPVQTVWRRKAAGRTPKLES
ncbi:hypothetical protein [Nitrosospira sp. NpAV]|uniref:hypothetical protein n=1 Tax=Nitrosospira sp. NpAV TaxID=58133 RepID=UPI00059F5953|nr:hypothetical protein [Nitrosospira sp. NpAV]KIO48128.1 hypothetical protein SQ11_13175 [Nitrosospira sp. NpAV]